MEERSIPDKFRSSHLQMFFKIGVLKKLCRFRRKTPVLEPRFNKKRLQRRCFLVKFAKFLRTPFLQNTSGGCSRKLNYRKKNHSEQIKYKNTQIFHFTQPFQTIFTCPNSIIKTEKHCTKYVQSETKKKFCETKCVNPYYPNFESVHKKMRFGVFLSVDNYFTFKNSKKYVLMVPGPKY